MIFLIWVSIATDNSNKTLYVVVVVVVLEIEKRKKLEMFCYLMMMIHSSAKVLLLQVVSSADRVSGTYSAIWFTFRCQANEWYQRIKFAFRLKDNNKNTN